MSQPKAQRNANQGGEGANPSRGCTRWGSAEDRALIGAMMDLVELGGWKTDNGQFKNGAYNRLEQLMDQKIPGCGMKAKPHIESRIKYLRNQYNAIAEMLGPAASGFGWNDEEKFVTCSKPVWDEWVKSHKNAVGLRNKPFPFFDDLAKIFGKDRAIGDEAVNPQDALDGIEEEVRDREEEEQEENVPAFSAEDTYPVPPCAPMGTSSSTTPVNRRSKKAKIENSEVLREFSSRFARMSDVMEDASKHIGRLASCFQHESDSAGRRMQVTSEIMKIDGLTPTQVMTAARKIALNPLEVDFFFSLPEEYRSAYVHGLLLPDQ